jgi:hypothetical protein
VDLLFIDGNHSYESVFSDYRNWYPKLNKGGIMAFHDYGVPKFSGIKKVVDEIVAKDNTFVDKIDTLWVGIK